MSSPTDPVEKLIVAINEHDLDAVRAAYSDRLRARRPGWPAEAGLEELLEAYRTDFDAFPDLHVVPLQAVHDDRRIVTEVLITGHNAGSLVMGDLGRAIFGPEVDELPATNEAIELAAAFVHETEGGEIVAERQYWGVLERLVQLGLVGGSSSDG